MEQKTSTTGTIAPLANVALCMTAMDYAITRPPMLPGLICLYGRTGDGKSIAATYTANKYNAYYIECRDSWTKKALLLALAKEVGITPPPKTMYELMDAICEALVASGRPLIIDEMDHIVKNKTVETIRDIYEGSRAAILLIGEEDLPGKLRVWKQFCGRILDFVKTEKASADDARVLMPFYCHKVTVEEDLLADLTSTVDGQVRLICTNLVRIEEEALKMGSVRVNLAMWKKWGKGYLVGGQLTAGLRMAK